MSSKAIFDILQSEYLDPPASLSPEVIDIRLQKFVTLFQELLCDCKTALTARRHDQPQVLPYQHGHVNPKAEQGSRTPFVIMSQMTAMFSPLLAASPFPNLLC